MSGTGALFAPRWPRKATAYERELDELRRAEESPQRVIEDDEIGGRIDG
jgi:hypothetical protein